MYHAPFKSFCNVKTKEKQPNGLLFFWLGMKDLNPHKQSQSLSCCHYTNPQCFVVVPCDVYYYSKAVSVCQVYFYKKSRNYTTFYFYRFFEKMSRSVV